MRSFLAAVVVGVGLASSLARGEGKELIHEPIFTIERSKNSNVVQYDLQLSSDGLPVASEPVIGYWRNTSGETWSIKKLQRVAYGFNATCSDACKVVKIKMRADIGRTIRVYQAAGRFRAETRIDGSPAFIERIYIKSIERRFLWPKVAYIDFEGSDTATGEQRTERFVP